MKLKVVLLLLTSILLLSFATGSAYGKNPFQAKADKTATNKTSTKPPNPFYFKLAMMQKELRSTLSDKMREVKRTGSYLPIVPLIFIAFLYGILHAAGPGHGKAIVASFLVSRGKRVADGFFLGGFIAILHGLSAIFLVLFLKFMLQKSVMGSMDEITYITKIVSYSLILSIGILLTSKNIYDWYRNLGMRREYCSGKYRSERAGSISAAIIVGIIPCPGTVLIMLFALSINMIGTGLILASAQTLGMALTVSVVGMLVVAGKGKTIDTLDYARQDIADIIERLIELLASTAIIAIGVLLLLSVL